MRKIFSREGIPDVLVTGNGTHFTEKNFNDWLKHIDCRHLYTAARHPQSNALAEHFVRTLKSAIASMSPKNFDELEKCVGNFLLQYRNVQHTNTHESPSKLFKSRILSKHPMSTTSDIITEGMTIDLLLESYYKNEKSNGEDIRHGGSFSS
ncbi:unnamed protein product [Trichobilharzia regenti]|nr:unnamed protein product [Trichobilharzia regenti]